jgi:putative membrane protein
MKLKRTFSTALVGTGTMAIALPEKAAFAYGGGSCGWGPLAGFTGGWGMGWFGPLLMMLFWGFLIAGTIILARWLIQRLKGRSCSSDPPSPLDIIRKRYASGEIDQEEFKQMQQALSGTSEQG